MNKIPVYVTQRVKDNIDISSMMDIPNTHIKFLWVVPILSPISIKHYLYYAESIKELVDNADFVGMWGRIGQPFNLSDVDSGVLSSQYCIYQNARGTDDSAF